jgi:hypothetical protein
VNVIAEDIWKRWDAKQTIVVPTNGTINSRGLAVMGRGVAKQAAERFDNLRFMLAIHLRENGNVPCLFQAQNLITFPVKHEWHEYASLELIKRSAALLVTIIDKYPGIKPVACPKVGCGNGGLNWPDVVEPVIESVLGGGYIEIVDLSGVVF